MPQLPEDMVLPEGFVPSQAPQPPAEPRDSATVALVRDTDGGPEVFLLRRVLGMAFAGGMTVFPGGGVDKRDADTSVAWAGPTPAWWARAFGCSAELARALVCAAVRETFEEAGVLLAGPDADSVVADATPYADARQELVERKLSLAEFLTEAGLVLRADLLRPLGNWVTPPEEPRRYDTRFFLAALPTGQRADGSTTEADHAAWQRPQDAIADWAARRSGLMPPTWVTLSQLAEHRSVRELLAAERQITKITPRVVRRNGNLHVALPGDADYPEAS
ncbi:NUDIX hydrolase [Crossiella sp. SN42]|uniref:NUDIX hydrolase n=1 Tax=Crossiella sp. SN42 TaxID=2944808 RepID=UPI0035ABFDEF